MRWGGTKVNKPCGSVRIFLLFLHTVCDSSKNKLKRIIIEIGLSLYEGFTVLFRDPFGLSVGQYQSVKINWWRGTKNSRKQL